MRKRRRWCCGLGTLRSIRSLFGIWKRRARNIELLAQLNANGTYFADHRIFVVMPSSLVRHLAHAPIKEALIDFRVKVPESFSYEALEPIVDAAKVHYEDVKPLRQIGAILDTHEHKFLPMKDSSLGSALWNDDKSKVLQFRLDGFTHNRLKPYESWTEFFSEAMKWWEEFKRVAKPIEITRLELRYINRLLLPNQELEKYLHY